MKMSVDDFKTVLSEFRSSEEKKNLYIDTDFVVRGSTGPNRKGKQ